MSAFLCSARHTYVIAMLAHNGQTVANAQIHETARILRQLNDAALRARYGDAPNPMDRRESTDGLIGAVNWMRTAGPQALLKVVQCFDYQCSEDISADYPGRAILADVLQRVSAMRGASVKCDVWSI